MSGLALAFFGLPLAACLLHGDGHEIRFAVLPALEPLPGARRLRRLLGAERVLAAAELGDALDRSVEQRFLLASPDLLVSWFWPRRIPMAWLTGPPLGAIGAHPSLLPRHRGPNPFYWAIDAGDAHTGVSVHRLTERYDEGAVLARCELQIAERNAWQLARALDRPSLRLLRATVARLAAGDVLPESTQEAERASWAPEPTGDALKVSWTWSTERILRRIRALSPVPGLALEVRGIRLFVTRAAAAASYPAALYPGEAATLGAPPEQLVIRTGDGAISVARATLAPTNDLTPEQELDGYQVAALVSAAAMVE